MVLTFHCLNKMFQWSQKFWKFSAFSLEFQKFFSIARTIFSHSRSEQNTISMLSIMAENVKKIISNAIFGISGVIGLLWFFYEISLIWREILPCTVLFWSVCLLVLRKFSRQQNSCFKNISNISLKLLNFGIN